MKHYKVVAAVIVHNSQILCVQRGISKFNYISQKFEFPGGKVEQGESKESAIVREIEEELNISISIQKEYMTVQHQYLDFELTMHSFICGVEDMKLTLTEHIDFKWLRTNELKQLDWAAADIPIVDKLMAEPNDIN